MSTSTTVYRTLSIASFAFYALAVLVLGEDSYSNFSPERYNIATAISHIAYGAPFGTVYSGVLDLFFNTPPPLQEYVARIASLGALKPLILDGNGFTYMFFVMGSMQILGVELHSLIIGFLCLMGLSVVLFCLRYSNERLCAIPVYFLGMTVLAFSALSLQQNANEIAIGGVRYFALLAVLPTLHLFWEITGAQASEKPVPLRYTASAILQLMLLLFVILVRSSVAYVLIMLLATAFFVTWRYPAKRRQLLDRIILLTIAGTMFLGAFYATIPDYYRSLGHVTGSVWHRVIVGLGVNPEWPFGDLKAHTDCMRYYPKGLVSGLDDSNAYCLWAAYASQHHLQYDAATLYTTQYDAALREIFFDIARNYPYQALKTFLYYKPLAMLDTARRLLDFHLPGEQPEVRFYLGALLMLQIALLLLAFYLISPTSRVGYQLLLALCLLWLFTLPTYFTAWSVLYTSAEMLLYMVAITGVLSGMAINRVHKHKMLSSLLKSR